MTQAVPECKVRGTASSNILLAQPKRPLNVKVSWCTEWFVTILLVESLVDLNSLFGRDQFTYIDPVAVLSQLLYSREAYRMIQNDTE